MKFIVLLFVSLTLVTCKTETKELPVLSYRLNNGEKEIYAIEYDGFKNQLNENFTTKNLNGKVAVANFFFTRCPSICPPMRQQLIELSNTINNEDFLIISHTIDPEHDTPEILKGYAEATGVASNRWQFVTSTETNTKALASLYMTNFKPNEDGTDFYHSSYAALLDKQQQIRGFYNLLILEEVDRLKEDISSLLK